MNESYPEGELVSFDCPSIPIPPGTPAAPRPSDRERWTGHEPFDEAVMVSFEADMEPVPPGTMAPPRPPGRERPGEPARGMVVVLRTADGLAPATAVMEQAQAALVALGLSVEVLPSHRG